ncbi:uncharacterized protein LOC124542853 [Vanessa cardui]|uniref:uncharacterized protein LOC124542853 n=1 Tax=Vanessa cardui TaxID=171605 RepID=UPI001F13AAF7|nr:uncharacterized protein LOC124542853 [Vanessa cardui]
MDKKKSIHTSSRREPPGESHVTKEPLKTAKGYDDDSMGSTRAHIFKRDKYGIGYKQITHDEYFGKSESISGSSDTFHCFHGSQGKLYTKEGRLKRNLIKELDPIQIPSKWSEKCRPASGWEVAATLEFMTAEPMAQQTDRIEAYLREFSKTSRHGYKIEVLKSLCVILEHLVENLGVKPNLREGTVLLLKNLDKPILLTVASNIVSQFDELTRYVGFLSYLLIRLEEDELFDYVARGLIWQLSAADRDRGAGAAPLGVLLRAAAPALHTVVRMLALCSSHRFPAFLQIALFMACDSAEYCIGMLEENVIENIFYRFNPYFPGDRLPAYENNPVDPQDHAVRLGDSSINMSTTLTLLLVLIQALKDYLATNATSRTLLPCPDYHSQRCFIWAYRFECRAREHHHERSTLTVITHALLHCFGDRLMAFSSLLMPDIMTLSVLTEVPRRHDWTRTVNFNTAQADLLFKKVLIYLSVAFLKAIPVNKFMVQSQNWLLGLMFLLDPGLSPLRAHWSPALFSDLRKTALQALVSTLPVMPPRLVQEYAIIRRILWYIEWYSESPYELPTLYWSVRLLQVATHNRQISSRQDSVKDLLNTHGIIILTHLCYTLLNQKCPPMEKSQVIIALCLRVLTSAVEAGARVDCCVYPRLGWPASVCALATRMLNVVLYSLNKHLIIADRWLISLLNFIWEAIVWQSEHRERFIVNSGVYNLLDIITVSKAPVQCLALAVLCDVVRSGDAVAQLVTWRPSLYPCMVKRGSSIAALLAAVFRDECRSAGIPLDEHGVIQSNLKNLSSTKYNKTVGGSRLDLPPVENIVQDFNNNFVHRQSYYLRIFVLKYYANRFLLVYHKTDFFSLDLNSPLQPSESHGEICAQENLEMRSRRTPECVPAAKAAGSRASKVFALLQLLSEDLKNKVSLADEAYNLYKNVLLEAEDEVILVLCSHYLTIQINETWSETKANRPGLLVHDEAILNEFLEINGGWAKDIRRQQQDVIENRHKRELEDENSLYVFLQRVRLNVALDALREVRCAARSARTPHRGPQGDAPLRGDASLIRTYRPPLDDQNVTGQCMKLYSIPPTNDSPEQNMGCHK